MFSLRLKVLGEICKKNQFLHNLALSPLKTFENSKLKKNLVHDRFSMPQGINKNLQYSLTDWISKFHKFKALKRLPELAVQDQEF